MAGSMGPAVHPDAYEDRPQQSGWPEGDLQEFLRPIHEFEITKNLKE